MARRNVWTVSNFLSLTLPALFSFKLFLFVNFKRGAITFDRKAPERPHFVSTKIFPLNAPPRLAYLPVLKFTLLLLLFCKVIVHITTSKSWLNLPHISFKMCKTINSARSPFNHLLSSHIPHTFTQISTRMTSTLRLMIYWTNKANEKTIKLFVIRWRAKLISWQPVSTSFFSNIMTKYV